MTAVEWLINELKSLDLAYESGKIGYVNYQVYKGHLEERAKQMEKQQREYSYDNGYANGQMDLITD